MLCFYKLNNYLISLDESVIDNCNIYLKTSSHIMIPLILKYNTNHNIPDNITRYKITYI